MLEVQPYQQGDLARVRNASFDPFALLGEDAELSMIGLRSIVNDGVVVCCVGWASFMPGVIGAFTLVDRVAAAGAGKELVSLLRENLTGWATQCGAHRIEATCVPGDRVAQVFLRAIGFRQESVIEAGAPDGSDLLQFKLIRR